jgi:tetratricopeptide (TPR) repeat protein
MLHPVMGAARAARVTGLVLALGLGVCPLAAAAPELAAPAEDVDLERAALDAAASVRRAAYEEQGEARESGLLAAAARYGAVADEQRWSAGTRAEGAFRAGEILRARGRAEEARARFEQAVTAGASVPREASSSHAGRSFGARAQLELGHALRRESGESEVEFALVAYEQVAARFEDQAKQVGQAAGWRARVLLKADRVEEAEQAAAVLPGLLAAEPMEAVRCADTIALALAEAGHEDRARRVLAALDRGLTPLMEAESDARVARRLADARDGLRVTLVLMGS